MCDRHEIDTEFSSINLEKQNFEDCGRLRGNVKMRTLEAEVDEGGSELCPVVGCDICDIEPSDSVKRSFCLSFTQAVLFPTYFLEVPSSNLDLYTD